jgi:hypothetical protein
MKKRARFPRAINLARVGKYPAVCKSGGGFVWDAVLEYRVWCHPENGAPDRDDGNDYYYAFASYPAALRFSTKFPGAEEPLALILQKQYIVEPSPGQYVHMKKRRITEWPVEFLSRRSARETPFPISCRPMRLIIGWIFARYAEKAMTFPDLMVVVSFRSGRVETLPYRCFAPLAL